MIVAVPFSKHPHQSQSLILPVQCRPSTHARGLRNCRLATGGRVGRTALHTGRPYGADVEVVHCCSAWSPSGDDEPSPSTWVPYSRAAVNEVVLKPKTCSSPRLRPGRGESSIRLDTIVLIRPLHFASVVVAAGLALAAFAGITRGGGSGGSDGPELSASTGVDDAPNDSRFRSL